MSSPLRLALGAVVGAAVGYGMCRFVGCRTGACPLTANPWIAMGIYGLLGAMVAGGTR
jgi:hypothetical protein